MKLLFYLFVFFHFFFHKYLTYYQRSHLFWGKCLLDVKVQRSEWTKPPEAIEKKQEPKYVSVTTKTKGAESLYVL